MYYFGIWFGGLYASLTFLRRAHRDREAGIPVRYVGCLHAVLWVHVALLIAAIAVAIILLTY